ncbi:MAG: oxidoreductase [Rhodoferax sp.]|nr:oxidoreductase [Rhodoferax sp.]
MAHTTPTIGIIGAGAIGTAIARALARARLPATLSNSRGPASLATLVRDIGPTITAGTREQAAAADLVFVAVNWSKLPAALAGLPDWQGRTVVDANNPIEAPLFQPVALNGLSSSEVFAGLVPGARVVKAFNHLAAAQVGGDPTFEGGQRVMFYAGDDVGAKTQVGALIEQLGFFGLDVGGLVAGGGLMQFPGGVLPLQKLVRYG